MIRLPWGNKTTNQVLARIIANVAERSGYNEYHVATIMSYFFEEVVASVCRGMVIRIPGFGAFYVRRSLKIAASDTKPKLYPAFTGSCSYALQVNAECPQDSTSIDLGARSYRRSNSIYRGSSVSDRRTRTTMELFRRGMASQARGLGLEV